MDKKKMDKVMSHLKNKWGDNFCCPMCKGKEWEVAARIYKLPEFFQENDFEQLLRDEYVLPVIPVTCSNCGYTVFVTAEDCGVLNENEDE